jgi:hypothetical protein
MLIAAIKITVITLLAALVVLVAFTCAWTETVNRVTAEMPIVINQAIAREGMLTRAAAGKQITVVSDKLDHQLTALRTDLFARVDTIEADSFQQIDQVRIDANQQIDSTRTAAVSEISKVSTPAGATITQAQALLPPAQHILDNTSQTSDLLLDCDHNPDCLANRVIPALKSTERMTKAGERTMNAIADATPGTAQAVQSTATDLSKIVKKFSQPVSWITKAVGIAASVLGKFLGM